LRGVSQLLGPSDKQELFDILGLDDGTNERFPASRI
jgi:hypothetical protein